MNTYTLFFCACGLLILGILYAHADTAPVLSARIIDRNNVTTDVHAVTFEPDYLNREAQDPSALYGMRGHAEMSVPRTDIQRIDFIDGRDDFNTRIIMRDGRSLTLFVNTANTMYTGTNTFGGVFRINTHYIRSIIYR